MKADRLGGKDAIDCRRCQAICCQLPVLLMPEDSVPEYLTERDEHDLRVMARADDGWCRALDRSSYRCTIYERRPQVCRDFAMAGPECQLERRLWTEAARALGRVP